MNLWSVKPLKSLSSCRIQLFLQFSYGPYSFQRASEPVQYMYSTTPLDCTDCNKLECLYNPAILIAQSLSSVQ